MHCLKDVSNLKTSLSHHDSSDLLPPENVVVFHNVPLSENIDLKKCITCLLNKIVDISR